MIYDFEKIEKQYSHDKNKLIIYLAMTNNSILKRLNNTDKEYILSKIERTYNEADDCDLFKLIDIVGDNISDILGKDLSYIDILKMYNEVL